MKKIAVVLSPGFEEIEAVTVIDILRRAGIDVVTAGLNNGWITGSHNIAIMCDTEISKVFASDFDGIVLPGGQPGSDNMKNTPAVLALLQEFNNENKLVAAICAAPTVLLDAGIINNTRVTSYPAEKNRFSQSQYSEENVVVDRNIVTSRGVGTAIEFSLKLVEILAGTDASTELAKRIVYRYVNR